MSDTSHVRHLTSPTNRVKKSDISLFRHLTSSTSRPSDKAYLSDISLVRHLTCLTSPFSDNSRLRQLTSQTSQSSLSDKNRAIHPYTTYDYRRRQTQVGKYIINKKHINQFYKNVETEIWLKIRKR